MQPKWHDSGLFPPSSSCPEVRCTFAFIRRCRLPVVNATTCTPIPGSLPVFSFEWFSIKSPSKTCFITFLVPEPGWRFCLLSVGKQGFSQHWFLLHGDDGTCVTFQNTQRAHIIKCEMSMLFSQLKQKGWHAYISCAISWCDIQLCLLFLVSLPITVGWDRSSSKESTKLQCGLQLQ